MKSRFLALFAGYLFLLGGGQAHAQSPLPGYHSHDQMTLALRELVGAHPELARLNSAGTTLQGRDIWVVEVGNEAGTPLDERPALLVASNLEGNQLVGSELSLQAIAYLLDNYSTDDDVRERLDNHVIYFFPRVNPDGAEAAFGPVKAGTRTNASPYDDDNDGRTDEDGPEDLNQDGWITMMRVAEPGGAYMIDPDDARLMKEADASEGETGGYSIYWEGLDSDGDGFFNDDPAGGVDLNRNFQHEYPYYEAGAGIHMVSELESRALMDFVISHRNIALMLVFGESDNLVTAPNKKGELGSAEGSALAAFADASNDEARNVGVVALPTTRFFRGFGRGAEASQGGRPSSGRRPETKVNGDDLAYFTAVSKEYKKLTGIESVPAIRNPEGAFFGYGYYQYGVPSFSTPGWAPEATADTTADSGGDTLDHRLLKWMDSVGVDGFVEWTPFAHPDLGEVEIGGFKPYASINPPFEAVQELGPKQGAFVVYLASLFARVNIAETEVTDEGGGIFRITADIENAGFLPTATAHGVRSRSVRPTMVQLGIDPDDLLSGSAKTSFFQATDGSGRRQTFEWIIRGSRGDRLELRVVSQKGGSDTATLELR